MALADQANAFVDEMKPWVLAKDPGRRELLHQVCTTGLNLFRLLTLYLKPILPTTAQRVEQFLDIPPLTWADYALTLTDHSIKPYQHLATRVDPQQLQAMLEDSQESLKMTEPQPPAGTSPQEPLKPEIGIDDFAKIDLRIARIVKAGYVEGADKLLQLTVDLGEGQTRNIFAGIRSAYEPKDLEGRLTVVVTNLAPRKMKFGVAQGMVLAAGPGGRAVDPPYAGAAGDVRPASLRHQRPRPSEAGRSRLFTASISASLSVSWFRPCTMTESCEVPLTSRSRGPCPRLLP